MTNTVTTLLVQDPNNDGDLWIECKLCGGCNYQSKGPIRHKRSCRSDAQYTPGTVVLGSTAAAAAPVIVTAEQREIARQGGVSHSGLSEDEIVKAVGCGQLSVSDAMNRDY